MSPAEKKKKVARQTVRQSVRQPKRQPTKVTFHQPVVVRTVEQSMTGIRSFDLSRYVIGYVISGRKFIYSGDLRYEVAPGDIFFFTKGAHYVEEMPEDRKPFEQIMFFYTPEQMGHVIAHLNVDYNIDTCVCHSCEECLAKDYVIAPGWSTLKHFFESVKQHLKEGYFTGNPTAEMISLTLLTYYIISQPEGCLRTRVLGSSDPEKELMERQLHAYIFSNIPLEQFANNNNRGLSSFKKKFKEYFKESPHRWVTRQRLMHARLLIVSTDKSAKQVGIECCMPNTSHFIKQFKTEFGLTPFEYRRKYRSPEVVQTVKNRKKKTVEIS